MPHGTSPEHGELESPEDGASSEPGLVTLGYSTDADRRAEMQAPAGRLDFATIGLRLLATYFIAVAVPGILLLPVALVAGKFDTSRVDLVRLAPSVGHLLIGGALWLVSKSVARWMLRDTPLLPETNRGRIGSARMQSLAFSVLGLSLLAYAARHIANIAVYATMPARDDILYDRSDLIRESAIDLGVEAAVGAAIFFGARKLSHFWHRKGRAL